MTLLIWWTLICDKHRQRGSNNSENIGEASMVGRGGGGWRVGTEERKSTERLLCVNPFLKSP